MSVKASRQWFRFENAVDGSDVAEIHIIDFIGDWIDDFIGRNFGVEMGVTARAFVEELAKVPASVKSLRVHINSPGGDVFSALNIANALREQQASKGRTVETVVDGLAASAASIIMMAGSKITVADNALVMIHNPWTYAVGNAASLQKVINELGTVRNTIVATYQWHSQLEASAIEALMDGDGDGTWMSADEAIANGFATDKIEGLQAAASIDRRSIKSLRVPEQFRARVEAFVKPEPPAPAPAPVAAQAAELLPLCTEAGASMEFFAQLLAEGLPLADARTRIAADKTQRQEAQHREREIRALCEQSGARQLAEGYIAGGMNVAAVRSHLTTITALVDGRVNVDGNLGPDAGMETVGAGWKQAFARVNRRRLSH